MYVKYIYKYIYIKSQATFLFSTPLRSEVVNKEERIVTPQFLSVSKIIPNKFANARPSPTALRFRWSNKQPSGDIGPNPPNHLPELSSFPSSFKIKNKCFRLSSPLLAFLRPRSSRKTWEGGWGILSQNTSEWKIAGSSSLFPGPWKQRVRPPSFFQLHSVARLLIRKKELSLHNSYLFLK